jgi:hypothetical protein
VSGFFLWQDCRFKINLTPLLSHKNHFFARRMKLWCDVQAYFADLRYRPLGGRLRAAKGAKRCQVYFSLKTAVSKVNLTPFSTIASALLEEQFAASACRIHRE